MAKTRIMKAYDREEIVMLHDVFLSLLWVTLHVAEASPQTVGPRLCDTVGIRLNR